VLALSQDHCHAHQQSEAVCNGRDLKNYLSLRTLWQNWLGVKGKLESNVREYRWMVEMLRVSLFAQELFMLIPVSAKRVTKAWEVLAKM
jgi:ATP-dependent helicase HrpA